MFSVWYTNKNEEIARDQLMTYLRQFLLSPTLIHPTYHPYPQSIQPSFKATYRLSTYYMSTQPIPSIHHSVSEPISTYIFPESKFYSLYPLPCVLFWILISITWSMFPLLIPFNTHFENLNHIPSCSSYRATPAVNNFTLSNSECLSTLMH